MKKKGLKEREEQRIRKYWKQLLRSGDVDKSYELDFKEDLEYLDRIEN